MLRIIRVYYDIKNKQEYENFLFNYLIRNYLQNGDLRLIKNLKSYNQHYIKLMDGNEEEIEIICKPLIETAVRGYTADIVYIQNTALYKTDSDILNNIAFMFKQKKPAIYIFNNNHIIGLLDNVKFQKQNKKGEVSNGI